MKIECSEGSSGVWSWRFKSDSGTTIAEGVKTFDTRANAEPAISQFAETVGVKSQDISYVPLVPEKQEEEEE